MTNSSDNLTNLYTKKTKHAGNGLFASKDIPAGDLVLRVDRPFLAVLDSPHLNDACSNCFVWVPQAGAAAGGDGRDNVTLRVCTGCKIVRYCGKTCQSSSWTRTHKYECKIFARLYPKVLPNTARMILQLLLLKQAHALPDHDWQAFLALESHIDSIKSAQTSDPSNAFMRETVNLMSKAAQSYSNSPEPLSQIHTLTARLLINTLTLCTPTHDPLGLAFFPLASLCNHSCAPNATITFCGPHLSIRSLLAIPPSTEITIAYIDPSDPVPTRLHHLRTRYFFTCTCPQCAHCLTANHPSTPPALAAVLSAPAIAALEAHASDLLARARAATADPPAQCALLEEALALFAPYEHVWPLYRQPWGQLRQEAAVASFACGEWTTGLAHALKGFFYVDPVVYAQEWHPVRVVHGWVLVRVVALVAELLSEREDGNSGRRGVEGLEMYGIEWGVVHWGLLSRVQAVVGRSHGEESSFARMVGKRMVEVREDMRMAGVDVEMVEAAMEREWAKLRRVADEVVA